MQKNNLEKIFDFLEVSGNLKNTYRYGDVAVLNDESSADHSWRLALMVLIFAEELKLKINLEYALKLAIIHDLPESITGDIPANRTMVDGELKKEKLKNEIKAIERLKSLLPEFQGDEIQKIWNDFEFLKSEEAKFVNALDKLEAYTNWVEAGYRHIEKCEDLHLIPIYPDEAVKIFPELMSVLKTLKQKMKEEFEKGGLEWREEYNYSL